MLLRINGKRRGPDHPSGDNIARRFKLWADGDFTLLVSLFEGALTEAPGEAPGV